VGLPALVVLVLALTAACENVREIPTTTDLGRAPARTFDAPTQDGTWYSLVGSPQLDVPGSTKRLVASLTPRPHLRVKALSSAMGTAAVAFIEKSREQDHWGAVMTPAERQAFGAFAADPTMGQWLVVFTDVDVKHGTDPIPMTGYRWRRPDVEAYAECGIPSSGLDTCTRAFYTAPEMVLLPPRGKGTRGG
jgi:hypothetical protein